MNMGSIDKGKLLFSLLVMMLTGMGAIYTSGVLTSQQNLTNTGTIVINSLNIGVYSDAACTNAISSLTWGTLHQDESTTKTVYLKNTGNVAATLSCSFTNWSPTSASNYITASWNKEGTTISPNQVVQTTFTLTVSPTIIGISSYSFTTTISGTG